MAKLNAKQLNVLERKMEEGILMGTEYLEEAHAANKGLKDVLLCGRSAKADEKQNQNMVVVICIERYLQTKQAGC